MGRVGSWSMRCGLYMGRSARPMRRPICFDGPARTATYDMWCTTATTTTTSTVPMRPPTFVDGPVRAVAHEMWCTAATTTSFWVCLGRYLPKTATWYIRTMHFWHIPSCVIDHDILCKCGIKAFAPLWVYRRLSLPSRRRGQPDALALVRPADGAAGATS